MDLRCSSCQKRHPTDMLTLACGRCAGPLEVDYLQPTRRPPPEDTPLPVHTPSLVASLGEGDTPYVQLPAAGRLLGIERLFGKLEFLNPTGSFKDRGSAMMMAAAVEHGVEEVVEDSSGNAGASVAAYAARAGIKAHIFVPDAAPEAKLRQIRAYGAELHAIEGSREDATAAAVAFYRERGLVYASHSLSPYFLEGTKSFAYEVARGADSLPGLPDHIIFPVGNGSLYIGAWRGFEELRAAGHAARVRKCTASRPVP